MTYDNGTLIYNEDTKIKFIGMRFYEEIFKNKFDEIFYYVPVNQKDEIEWYADLKNSSIKVIPFGY